MQAPPQFSMPSQGFLGGIGMAISATLLLYSTGRTLGVSGMIHRSIRSSSPLSSSARQGDIAAILGLLLGGICVGALEEKYARSGGTRQGNEGGTDSLAGTSVFGRLATVALAGLLCGIGTKSASGCTSGHMICGISRFSRRSFIATLVFFSTASLTVQFRRQNLPPIEGYDWSLGPIGVPLLQILGALIVTTILLLTVISHLKESPHGRSFQAIFNGLIPFLSALTFALGVRLSSLNFPAKVTSFLILPIPDPKLFDATLAFLSLGALPLTALLYYLGGRLQPPQKSAVGKPGPSGSTVADSEREPLTRSPQNPFPFWGSLPVLEGYAWPECPSSIIDRRLIGGSILFGVGWGMLGVCPCPAVLNFGVSIYSLSRGQSDPLLVERSVWLATFVAGGLVAP